MGKNKVMKNIFTESSIARKLWVWFLIVAAVPLMIVGLLTNYSSIETIKTEVSNRLNSVAESKTELINNYFKWRLEDVKILSENLSIIEASEKFTRVFEKHGLKSSEYKVIDKEFRRFLTYHKEGRGYSDILFISKAGDVVFTLMHEPDFGTNLITGPYKDSELANVFSNAYTLMETEISDFKYYSPSAEPVSFIASPVRKEGKLIAVIAFQIDTREMNKLAQDFTGLGETGEIVISSKIKNGAIILTPLRNDPHAAFKRIIPIGSVRDIPSQKAVQGQRGSGIFEDYRGVEVLAVWRYLPYLRWGVVVKIDVGEAYTPIYKLTIRFLAVGIISAFVLLFISFFLSKSISKPIKRLQEGVEIIATGNLNYVVGITTKDEIGQLSRSFDRMVVNLKNINADLTKEITERKRAEETLRESEEKYRTLIDNNQDGVFIIQDVKMQFVNEAFARMVGYAVEEVIGMEFRQLVAPEDLEMVADRYRRRQAGEDVPREYEFRMLHKDGKTWVLVNMNVGLIDYRGRIASMGTVKDITERKRAEEELKQSEQRYRTIVETVPDIIYTLAADDGRLTSLNPAFETITGWSREEWVGKTFSTLVHPEDMQLATDTFQQVLRGEYPRLYELRILAKSGEYLIGEFTSMPQFKEGKIVGELGIARNITERKRAELERQAMFEIIQGVTITDNLDELLQLIHQALKKVLYAENCFIALYNHNTGLFSFPYFVDQFDTAPAPQALEKSCTSYVFRTGRPMSITEELFQQLKEQGEVELVGTPSPSWLGVPLRTPSEMIGVLVVQHYDDEYAYTKRDVEFFASVGNQIALAIERKQAENRIKKINRIYVVLSNINQTIVRTHDVKQLFNEICRIAIEDGKFKMSWIGMVNPQTNKVDVVASAGHTGDYLNKINIDLSDEKRSQGLTGKTVKSGVHHISGDIANDGSMLQWREDALRLGYRSAASFPIKVFGIVQGVFNIYSSEVDFFDEDEIKLLNELTMDISFALEFMERETERRRAEQEIISQKNRFAQLFENSPIAIVLIDDQDKIVQINESFSALFGYFLEEIRGQSINDLIVPPELKEEAKSYSDQTRAGNQVNKESYRKKKDGTLVYVQIVGVPVIVNDKTVGVYGTYVDLTQRKNAEAEIIKAKELAEQSDKLKTEFLSQMSHEIRTPINIVISNSNFIKEELGDKIAQEYQDLFEGIELSSKRIIRTIDLILNMSELQTDSYKPILREVDINSQVIGKLFNEYNYSAKYKGLDLIYKCEAKESKIVADEYSIIQIFANLIDNAIKYTKKGKVEILLTNNKKGDLIVEVNDTGIGMSKDFLSHLFEPFIQEEQGYTRSFEGNGLGLALVKNYCDINNASIEVESEKNVGSTFRVIFSKV